MDGCGKLNALIHGQRGNALNNLIKEKINK